MDKATRERLKKAQAVMAVSMDKVEKEESAKVTYRCGHSISLKQVQEHQDCPCCAKIARRKKGEEWDKKQKERLDTVRTVKADTATNRLPDGSVFHVSYDATTKTWTGMLTVPTIHDCSEGFVGTASGVFSLLKKLDEGYRKTLTKDKT